MSKSKREQAKRNKIKYEKYFDEVAAEESLSKLVINANELIQSTYDQLNTAQKKQMASQVSNILIASINEIKTKLREEVNAKKN